MPRPVAILPTSSVCTAAKPLLKVLPHSRPGLTGVASTAGDVDLAVVVVADIADGTGVSAATDVAGLGVADVAGVAGVGVAGVAGVAAAAEVPEVAAAAG